LEKEERKREIEKAVRKKKSKPVVSLVPRCWGCRTEGVKIQDVHAQMVISLEKVKMKADALGDKANILELMDRAKRDAVNGQTVLITHKVPEEKMREVGSIIGDMAPFIRDLKAVMLCHDCSEKVGLKLEIPKMDMKTLNTWTTVADMMKPEIQKMAQEQIDQECKEN